MEQPRPLSALSDVERLIVHALDELPDSSVMVFDTDMRFVLVRGGALALNALTPEDFEQRLPAECLPPARWAFYRPLFEAALRGESTAIRTPSPDSRRQYVVRVTPVTETDGRIIGGVAVATDVTEQAALASELRATERRYRLAVFSSGVATALMDAEGGLEEVNEALCAWLGYRADELIGRPFTVLIHADDAEAARTSFEAMRLGTREIQHVRLRLLRSDGELGWCDVTASALRDEDGRLLGSIAQLVDVTREVEELDALTDSENRYRMLVENAFDVIFHQVEGEIRWISPSVEKLLGWTAEDLQGATTRGLWHPDDREAAFALREAAYNGLSIRDVLRIQHRDGHYLWVEAALRPAPVDGHGGMVGTLRDVTARVEAETALRDTEGLYRLVAENASDVVLVVAPDDTFTWISPSARTVLGWDPAEAIGKRGTDFVHPDDLARMASALVDTRAGDTREDEYRIRRADGQYVWVSVLSTPMVDAAGRPAGRLATLRDVDAAVQARRQLEESEERFRLAMDSSAAGMCIIAPEGRFLEVNQSLCEILGRSESDLLEMTWPEVAHPDELSVDLQLIDDLRMHRVNTLRRQRRYLRPDGSVVWCDVAVAPILGPDGEVRYMVVQIIDITARVEAEITRAAHEELLRVVLDNSGDGTIRFDPRLRVEYVNARAVEMSGIAEQAWLGRTLAELGYPGGDTPLWTAQLLRVLETRQPASFEYQIEPDGATRWFEARLAPEFGPDGGVVHVVATSRDITQRRQAQDELVRLATHDPLTGLANRTMLLEEIERAVNAAHRSGRTTGVLMIDLDRFKAVNDSLGHGIGDELLLAAADRIASSVRGGDLVGRLGGDEFVVVMRDMDDPSEAVTAAWRLVSDFRAAFMIGDVELYSTASIGVAICSDTTKPADAIREADTAMFVSKNNGRDQVTLYNEELRSVVSSRLSLEVELRHAIERKQLMVWYQPEVDLVTGRVIATEALVRWCRNDDEVLTAESFIDVAEEAGLILDIGRWVLREACAQAAQWARDRPQDPITVRVNVSAIQLVEGGLIDDIDSALAASGLDPARLCIEITETALLRETAAVRRNLAHVTARGIHIALDDFGTGYASLGYLRQYPVDVLKIDRAFVTNITTDEHDQRLVTGIVALAEALGIAVTGEGVETAEQATTLRDLGCPGAQGFLFSRAVPADEMTALLDRTFVIDK